MATFEEVNARARQFCLEVRPVGNDKYILAFNQECAEILKKSPLSLDALNFIILFMEQRTLDQRKFIAFVENNRTEDNILFDTVKKARHLGFTIAAIDRGYLLIDDTNNLVATHIIFSSFEDISVWLDKFKALIAEYENLNPEENFYND